MYKVNDVVIFHINDAHDEKVKIRLIKAKFKILGYQIWRAEVLEIIKKSDCGGTPKVGSKMDISERLFVNKVEA